MKSDIKIYVNQQFKISVKAHISEIQNLNHPLHTQKIYIILYLKLKDAYAEIEKQERQLQT